jgi:hypothetical protein
MSNTIITARKVKARGSASFSSLMALMLRSLLYAILAIVKRGFASKQTTQIADQTLLCSIV